jgi:polar amino acid transport system substrate-binding protein
METPLMKIARFVLTALLLTCLVALLVGCGSTGKKKGTAGEPLRVGVSPNYPPVIFHKADKLRGLEVDLAVLLARARGRPVRFVEVDWNQQIPPMLQGETDIIMSGMSITPAREVRVAFADAYFTNGLVALMRTVDAERFDSVETVLDSATSVGVIKGTTGDMFVQANMPGAKTYALQQRDDVIHEFARRRINLYIDDAAAAAYIVSQNEAELTGLWIALHQEPLAWALRQDDREMRERVNATLAGWREDGTLDRVLRRWLPFMPGVE